MHRVCGADARPLLSRACRARGNRTGKARYAGGAVCVSLATMRSAEGSLTLLAASRRQAIDRVGHAFAASSADVRSQRRAEANAVLIARGTGLSRLLRACRCAQRGRADWPLRSADLAWPAILTG